MRKNRGFTLIELLIVVAIIAILAAIAVPNFLEAQTRAKVSRVKADMRSVGTALETYAVDYNKYPWSKSHSLFMIHLWQLTTPIAFLNSPAIDPFGNPEGGALFGYCSEPDRFMIPDMPQ